MLSNLRIHSYHITALVALAAVMVSTAAVASPITTLEDPLWSWSFDQTSYVITPSESIEVRATFQNAPSSTMNMVITGVGGMFAGDLQRTFGFALGPRGTDDIASQLFGHSIPPGGELPFVFGILTPLGGAAPVGTYRADPAFFRLVINGVFSEPHYSTNTFSVTVESAVVPPAVPEPSSLTLICLGLFALFGVRMHWNGDRLRHDGRVF